MTDDLAFNGFDSRQPGLGADFPRMLYRKTDKEQIQVDAYDKLGRPSEFMVINRYNDLLCETRIVNSADEAETAVADGWEVSPEAAYGTKPGLFAATSAKDDEIARLRAELEEAKQQPNRTLKPVSKPATESA